MRLTKPMMHGPAVRRLQEMLDGLGYNCGLPDGIFGHDTHLAVVEFQGDHEGLGADGIAGQQTMKTILSILNTGHVKQASSNNITFDRRGMHPPPRFFSRKRKWTEIEGVTLHQTGCDMPQAPYGWDRLNAHFGITREGLLIQVNDCTDMIYHAQGLSPSTIGIEIEGNYRGLANKPNTLWRGGGPACHLNDDMLMALDVLYGMLVGLFAENQMPWKRIYAHRQAKNTRIADPGQEIWQVVAIPWQNKSGATDGGSKFKRRTGKPIPREWAEHYHTRYWS